MSDSLVWQLVKKDEYRGLPHALMFKIRDLFDRASFPVVVGRDFIPWLSGLAACEIEGATELIDLIDQFENIELDIES